MSSFEISADIDGKTKTIVKRSTRSVVLSPDGVLYLNDVGLSAKDVDFTKERVITIRVKPTP